MSTYWNQWNVSDLDSWQGKDFVEPDVELDIEPDYEESEEENDEPLSLESLGMSLRDFM